MIIHEMVDNEHSGKIIKVNDASLNILKYTREEILSKNITDIIHPESLVRMKTKKFKKDTIVSCERDYVCSDGTVIHSNSSNCFYEYQEKKLVISLSTDISEKHNEQLELLRNEENYRKIVRNLPRTDAYLIDKELRFILADGSEMINYGLDKTHFEGKHLDEIEDSEVTRTVKSLVIQGLKGMEQNIEKFAFEKWYNIHSVPLPDNKNPDAVLILIRCIHKEKQHTERIRQLFQIIDHSDNAASIKDANLRFVAVNKAFLRLNQLEFDDVLGKTDPDIFGDNEIVRQYIRTDREALQLNADESINYEQKFITKDGKELFFLSKKFPVFNEEGQVTGIANISAEISDLKKAREELEEKEKRYRMLISNQGEGIGLVDPDEIFVFTNPAANYIFGVENLTGMDLKAFLDENALKAVMTETNKRKRDIRNSYELDITTGKGERKTLLVTATPQKDKNGNITGTFGVFRDISQRKYAEKMLKESEKELKELNATKDRFFTIIAHDLKNPFNSILGFSNLLIDNYDRLEQENIQKYLKLIYDASYKTYNLLENLLNWSRAQTGRINYEPSYIDIHKLISETKELLLSNIENKKIDFVINVDSDIRPYADSNMIQTVIRNLISNAIKFTPEDGKIEVRTERENDYFKISVIDNGMGISSKNKDKLFRLDSNFSTKGTDKETGTGLGLILCKDFVEKNKGEISVYSKPGKGSTFSFTLPCKKKI